MRQWGKFYEFFSGPEVEAPGTKKIDLKTVRAQVDHLYPHLSDKERDQLARQMVAAEKVETIKPYAVTGDFATTLAQARVLYRDDLKANGLTTTRLNSVTPSGTNKTHVEVELTVRDSSGQTSTRTYTIDLENDATVIANAKAEVSNPEHYDWDVMETRAGTTTTRTGRGRRLRGYLHHHSLDSKTTPHFDVTDESFRCAARVSLSAARHPLCAARGPRRRPGLRGPETSSLAKARRPWRPPALQAAHCATALRNAWGARRRIEARPEPESRKVTTLASRTSRPDLETSASPDLDSGDRHCSVSCAAGSRRREFVEARQPR